MSKVYIVTEGEYSDYHIEEVFSTRKKAEEFIEKYKEVEEYWYGEIEEYEIDSISDIKIIRCINMTYIFDSPFKKSDNVGKIDKYIYDTTNRDFCGEKIEIAWYDSSKIDLKIIANPNKPLEQEIERAKKIAYDTEKRINYIYKKLNITTREEINKMLKTR